MNSSSEKKPIRILLVAPYTYPYRAGGGINAFNFARYLGKRGYRVHLLSFNRNLVHRSREKKQGVSIFRIPYFNRTRWLKLLSLLAILPVYLAVSLVNRVVIIYGGYIAGWEFLILFARLFGKRVYFRSTMFGEDDAETLLNYQRWLKPLRKLALGKVSCYFSLTPSFSENYLRCGGDPEKLVETTQGVDQEWLQQYAPVSRSLARQKLNLPEEAFIILSTGILVQRKGYSRLFEILHELEIPFLYVVLGDYKLDSFHHFRQYQSEVNRVYTKGKAMLGERIRFEGFVEDVTPYLKAADLYLSGSIREGLSNALLEAMALGVAPVVRRINKMEGYLLEDGINAMLFDAFHELGDLIPKLFNDPSFRKELGRNASITIREGHQFKHTCERLKL